MNLFNTIQLLCHVSGHSIPDYPKTLVWLLEYFKELHAVKICISQSYKTAKIKINVHKL